MELLWRNYVYVSKKIVGYALSARNLAHCAEPGAGYLRTHAAAATTILRKTNRHIQHNPRARAHINDALAAANLSYDTFTDFGTRWISLLMILEFESISSKVKVDISHLKVAPYYGCQIVRPYYHFDDLDGSITMDNLLTGLGAEVTYYPNKVRCCGGMLMMTAEDTALKLNYELLQAAEVNGANVIATALSSLPDEPGILSKADQPEI